MANLWVQETYIDKNRNAEYGDTGVYETAYESLGELYRSCQEAWGRCTGRVYVDTPGGPAKPVGWVFVRRTEYEDTKKTYLQETWVTVHSGPPTKTTKFNYWEG